MMLFRPRLAVAAVLMGSLAGLSASQGQTSQPGPKLDRSTFKAATTPNTYTPVTATGAKPAAPLHARPIDEALRREFDLPPFYSKALVIRGLPVIGSDRVSDYAFLECAYLLDHMLQDAPPKVLNALTTAKVRMGIISAVEYTMDIPENQTRRNLVPAEAAFQDRRSRGLGGLPLATCGEENLLNLHGDPYRAENITLHEFAHTLASAVQQVDPAWYDRLTDTYHRAMKAGLFASSYSATNEQEYWAEGVQAWFNCAAPTKDATVHSGIWHREQLKAYDPDLAKLCAEIYGDGSWRYIRSDNRPLVVDGVTTTRPAADLAHLVGLDRDQMPTYSINNSPRVQAWPSTQRAPRNRRNGN